VRNLFMLDGVVSISSETIHEYNTSLYLATLHRVDHTYLDKEKCIDSFLQYYPFMFAQH
jgi:hypothetical protein